MGGNPKKAQNWFIKSCVFILTCLNFSTLQNLLHWVQQTYRDGFSHCSRQFLDSSILMPLALLPFLFQLFHISKTFPLEDSFHPGKQSHSGRDRVNREGGHGRHAGFGQKLLDTQQCGQVCSSITHHAMGKHIEKVFKKFTEAALSLSQQLQLVHWCRWVPRTLP